MGKLVMRRKTRRRLARERLYSRHFGTPWRRARTGFVALCLVTLMLAIHGLGRQAAGDTPLGHRRADSLRIASEYVKTPDFDHTFVEPLRNLFKRGAALYTEDPKQTVELILGSQRQTRFEETRIEDIIAESSESIRSFSRTPVKSSQNFAIEVLRNAREHLALAGHDVRRQPDKERFQTFLEIFYVPSRLAQLEQRLPGICPGQSTSSVPETQELLAHAIARRLEVPYIELGELIYCSERIETAQRKRGRR